MNNRVKPFKPLGNRVRGYFKPLTEDEKTLIIVLWEKGETIGHIGDEVKRHTSTVSKVLTEYIFNKRNK